MARRVSHTINITYSRNPFSVQFCRLRQQHVILQKRHYAHGSREMGGVSMEELASALSHCTNLIRKYDRPAYTLAAFIPNSAKSTYIALRCLNIELARIADTTSNPALGALRYQFWRDTIEALYTDSDTDTSSPSLSMSTPKKHPISIILAFSLWDLASRNPSTESTPAPLSKPWLLRLINARERQQDRPFVDTSALEQYAEDTYSTLLYLTLQSLPLASVTADHIASHIGKATGIAAMLRGLPLLAFPPPANHHSSASLGGPGGGGGARQGTVTLPLDVMAQHGVREEDVFRQGAATPGLRDAVFEVATRANDHLLTARQMVQDARKGGGEAGAEEEAWSTTARKRDVAKAWGPFMTAVDTDLWLRKLEGVDFDAFSPILRRSDWRLAWRGWWAYRRGVF